MRTNATRAVLPIVAILTFAASVDAQTPAIGIPFYGTYATGSPELTLYPNMSAAEIVYRPHSASGTTPPASRGEGFRLLSGLNIAESFVEVSAISYLNDVFAAWGPWSLLPSNVLVRKSTIGFTVSPGSTVVRRSNGIPVNGCTGAPVSAQIFRSIINTTKDPSNNIQNWGANDAVAATCGVGEPATPTGTQSVIGSLAFEPNSSLTGGHPVFFSLTRASCTAINSNYFGGSSIFKPCNIYYTNGEGSLELVMDGVALMNLDPNDGVDAHAINNVGCLIFSLDQASPTVMNQLRSVAAIVPQGIYTDPVTMAVSQNYACKSVLINQNTLIGYVPASAALFMPQLSVPGANGCPTPYNWDLPFLWLDPVELGLDSISDNLNGLEVADPPSVDGLAGDVPLRGAPGDKPQDRLSLFAQGVAGDGGGVVPVPVKQLTPIQIDVKLPTTANNRNLAGWILWGSVGRGSEFTWTQNALPSAAPFNMFFDLFDSTTIAVAGSYPPSGSLAYMLGAFGFIPDSDHAELSIPGGLPYYAGLDSFTLQVTAAYFGAQDPLYSVTVHTSNCVELNLYPGGSPVVPLGQTPASFP
jgi:hypothetical protein